MSISVKLTVSEQINFAIAGTIGNFVKSVQVEGCMGQTVILRVYGAPKFFHEFRREITPNGDVYRNNRVKLQLDDEYFRQNALEGKDATVNVEVLDKEQPEKILASAQETVHLQPYLQWDRLADPTSLVSFMQPSDPLVAKVLGRAGELANASGGMMVNYVPFPNTSPIQQAEWIFQALKEEQIHYYYPPVGFETCGQKVRVPGMVLNEECKQGTCLDLAVLYATCLEAASLNPVLFVVDGHAFAGLWLKQDDCFDTYICDNIDSLNKMLFVKPSQEGKLENNDEGSLVPVECTFYTDDRQISFNDAVSTGLESLKEKKLHFALDVQLCRERGYTPAFSYTGNPICDAKPIDPLMIPSNNAAGKLERLQKQAMDMSLRNKLLNLNNANEKLVFGIDSKAFFATPNSGETVFAEFKSSLNASKADEEETEKKLYYIMKSDSEAKQRSGVVSTFLAIDMLSWIPADSTEPIDAPIFLCPAKIYRNIRGEIVFKASNEAFINPALKQMLYSEYGLDISSLLDTPGDKYEQQIDVLRQIIDVKSGWELRTDNACLLNCRMPNEAIYQGLKNEELLEHDIVQGVLDGAMTWDNSAEEQTDEAAEKAIYAFPADSYQRRIIHMIQKKRALVTIGPAGNGKSQTIANVIAEHIAKGKKVLFVAEKPAARMVVYDKLKELELDAFCLNISGNENDARSIKDKLVHTLRYISNYESAAKTACLAEYEALVEEFRSYFKKLTEKDAFGRSLLGLYGEVDSFSGISQTLDLSGIKDDLDKEHTEKIIAAYAEILKRGKPYSIVDLRQMKSDTSAQQIESGKAAISKARFAYEVFETKARELASKLECSESSTEKTAEQALRYAKVIGKCPVVGEGFDELDPEVLLKIIRLTKDMTEFPSGSVRYNEADEQLKEVLSRLDKEATDTNKLFFTADRMRFMGGVRPGRPNGGFSKEEIEYIRSVKRYRQYENKLFEISVVRPEREREALIKNVRQIAKGENAVLRETAAEVIKLHDSYEAALAAAADCVLKDHSDADEKRLLDQWSRYSEDQVRFEEYYSIIDSAEKAGILGVIYRLDDKIAKGELSPDQVLQVFIKSRDIQGIEEILKNSPEISNYNKLRYPFRVLQLQSKETPAREEYRARILDLVVSTMPNIEEGVQNNHGLGAIQRWIRNTGTRKSIRGLFEQGEDALTQLYPCVIMSPDAVAEYIPSSYPKFDLVIFDESSQLQTFKALIPLAHAEKCMIVGDEKQLVPTSFFKKNTLDENGMVVNGESILEDAIATSMPQLMLNYHYRSKYESLIAFSNAKYYDGEMISFPNPDTEFEGLEYVYLENGVYDRGGKRTNEPEAEKVVEIVRGIYEQLPEETEVTVGVITFGIEQMKLIQEMIRVAVRENVPNAKQIDSLADVVNLESCQGREWDVTVLSMTYGKNPDGELARNFGPMGREEGRNRLNVMITRARKKMVVVTSMEPEEFGENAKAGVADIRDFLAYAKGKLKLDTRQITHKETDKPQNLRESIADILREKGYVVHTNIGSSACKIDIGVVSSEDNTNKYQLGILLDDFADRFDVVDRETVVTDTLKNKGWKIYRLHCAEWYRNPANELKQIETLLSPAK